MSLCAPILAASTQPVKDPLLAQLVNAAPGIDRDALRHAVAAMQCAVNNGADKANRLAVIDYSKPSSAKRLWIFDLKSQQLILRDYVAHGRMSGENIASQFSNRLGSYQSSLGLFRTSESYSGKHGLSLRMDGLEPGLNDLARERAIVIHGASYVDPNLIRSQGRIGRSLGCPAVRPEVARMVVNKLSGGQFLFAWHPKARWPQQSAYFNCKPRQVASIIARSLGPRS
ncbi:murein L,D-transpeptidase catalytic domain family protein [Pseudomonas sp. M30-35]|uniref:murein L,D-transpeptidase catalytic domain family protein n=1 Tax=Pseudomonas sp. M30-35 TaxID=1981174 RepID=UPI0035320813